MPYDGININISNQINYHAGQNNSVPAYDPYTAADFSFAVNQYMYTQSNFQAYVPPLNLFYMPQPTSQAYAFSYSSLPPAIGPYTINTSSYIQPAAYTQGSLLMPNYSHSSNNAKQTAMDQQQSLLAQLDGLRQRLTTFNTDYQGNTAALNRVSSVDTILNAAAAALTRAGTKIDLSRPDAALRIQDNRVEPNLHRAEHILTNAESHYAHVEGKIDTRQASIEDRIADLKNVQGLSMFHRGFANINIAKAERALAKSETLQAENKFAEAKTYLNKADAALNTADSYVAGGSRFGGHATYHYQASFHVGHYHHHHG